MTVRRIPATVGVDNRKDLVGESTDTKPTTDVGVGSTFLEFDTKNIFMFDGTSWRPM